MLNHLNTFILLQKHKKMIRENATFILNEIAQIIDDTITNLEKEGRIKTPLYKEILKFECTALALWLFRISGTFPDQLHRLMLDEIHSQYYNHLKKRGYNKNALQVKCDDLNLRYQTYDKFTQNQNDFVKVGVAFAKFLSENSNTDEDVRNVMIAGNLIEQMTAKFKEFLKILK